MKTGKVLAVDYGSKRIGIATGDLEMKIAFPRDVILNRGVEESISEIVSLVMELGVVLVIVGLPLNMENEHTENPIMKSVKQFVEKLSTTLFSMGVEIQMIDERLSSFEADQLMAEVGVARKDVKQHRDAHAAQVILQRFFDGI